MTENEYIEDILRILKQHNFKIWREVNGIHIEGNNVRIDAIVKPPFGEDIYFGIEFKGTFDGHSYNYKAKHIKQSVDYSYSKFGKEGRRLYIFLAPNPFKVNDENYGEIAHILTQFNIGVIDKTKYGLTFILGGHLHHRIWSEKEGLKELGKKRTWKIKVGSQ